MLKTFILIKRERIKLIINGLDGIFCVRAFNVTREILLYIIESIYMRQVNPAIFISYFPCKFNVFLFKNCIRIFLKLV